MIDEYPILAVAAAFAEGTHDHARPGRIARQGKRPPRRRRAPGLKANGVKVEESSDGLIVEGRGADGVEAAATSPPIWITASP